MSETLLGIAAGIVAIGVAVMLGIYITIGPELAMHRENWELARILVPSITSIMGWLITIWWALRQVNISAEKNRQLQREMLESNENIRVLDKVIESHWELEERLHALSHQVGLMKINAEYKMAKLTAPDLKKIFDESGEHYASMLSAMTKLRFYLIRMFAYEIELKSYDAILDTLEENFRGTETAWHKYQLAAAKYLQDEDIEIDELCNSTVEVINVINSVIENRTKAIVDVSMQARNH